MIVDSVESAEAEPASIRVVRNWYEEFRDREQEYGVHPICVNLAELSLALAFTVGQTGRDLGPALECVS